MIRVRPPNHNSRVFSIDRYGVRFQLFVVLFLVIARESKGLVNYKRSVILNWPQAYDNRKNICLLGMRKLSPQVCIYFFYFSDYFPFLLFTYLHVFLFCFCFWFFFFLVCFFRVPYTIYRMNYAGRKAMLRAT